MEPVANAGAALASSWQGNGISTIYFPNLTAMLPSEMATKRACSVLIFSSGSNVISPEADNSAPGKTTRYGCQFFWPASTLWKSSPQPLLLHKMACYFIRFFIPIPNLMSAFPIVAMIERWRKIYWKKEKLKPLALNGQCDIGTTIDFAFSQGCTNLSSLSACLSNTMMMICSTGSCKAWRFYVCFCKFWTIKGNFEMTPFQIFTLIFPYFGGF